MALGLLHHAVAFHPVVVRGIADALLGLVDRLVNGTLDLAVTLLAFEVW